MFKFKNLNKKNFVFLIGSTCIAAVAFLIPKPALADVWGSVASVLGAILLPIINLFGKLMSVMIRLLITVAQYNDFINSPAVSKGWIIIRDLFNMLFVVVLLVIAFATVLKIEKYHYKKLLGGFFLAAVLVNFSKLICGIIIDVSQILMLTFVSAFKAVGEGNMAEMLGLKSILSFSSTATGSIGAEKLGAVILGLIMVVIGLVVVTVITIILVFRIVMLWFLVLLSPFAFFANVLPSYQKYSNQWWSKFTNQVIVGPVLAFFLWLSLAVVQEPSLQEGGLYKTITPAGSPGAESLFIDEDFAATISEAGKPQYILNFIIGIAMLVGSLMVAQQLGVAGGQMAGKVSGKIHSIATGAAKFPFSIPQKAAKGAWKMAGGPEKVKSFREGLADGTYGKMGRFYHRQFTKEGKKEVSDERLMSYRLARGGMDYQEIKSRMDAFKAAKSKKQMEERGLIGTKQDRKDEFEKNKGQGKLYTEEGLAVARAMAENGELGEKYYKDYGQKMGSYVEKGLRGLVSSKDKILGIERKDNKVEMIDSFEKKIAGMSQNDLSGLVANLDCNLEKDDKGEMEAASERAPLVLTAFSKEKFKELKLGAKKDFMNKMGLLLANGKSTNGGIYGISAEEYKKLEQKYSDFKTITDKDEIDIEDPGELKIEHDAKLNKMPYIKKGQGNKDKPLLEILKRLDNEKSQEFIKKTEDLEKSSDISKLKSNLNDLKSKYLEVATDKLSGFFKGEKELNERELIEEVMSGLETELTGNLNKNETLKVNPSFANLIAKLKKSTQTVNPDKYLNYLSELSRKVKGVPILENREAGIGDVKEYFEKYLKNKEIINMPDQVKKMLEKKQREFATQLEIIKREKDYSKYSELINILDETEIEINKTTKK